MSLKGSLESFSLGEIFQSLSINQHTGTLVVQDKDVSKLIYFTNGFIIHLSTGKSADFRLGDMLVWSKQISRDQLEDGKREHDTTGRRLGEILVERGYTTEEAISEMVVKNIEEEIYDLFLWKKADFEFKVGYFPDDFLDADQKATRVQLSTNSLIMEALRRIDEWTVIRDRISTLKAVFAPSNGEIQTDGIADVELPEIVKEEVSLVDGHRNVAEIVSTSPASKFEICKLLYELLQRDLIRPLAVSELVALSEDQFSRGQFGEARKYLEFAVEQDSDNPDLRLQLADAYSHTGAEKAAVDHLLTAARLHAEQEEYEMTVVAYRKALEIQSRSPEIMQKLFDALIKADKLVQAQVLGLELGELLREALQFSKAVEVYQKLAERDPKETSVRMLLAGAYKGKGDHEKALVEYNRVADQLENEMRFTELEKVYRILKALATKDDDLIKIRRKYERIEQRREVRERRRKLLSYGTILFVFLGLVAAGWEFWSSHEYQKISWPKVYQLFVLQGMSMDQIYRSVEKDPEDKDRFGDYIKKYEEWIGPEGDCPKTLVQLEEFRAKHIVTLKMFQARTAAANIRDLQEKIKDRQSTLLRQYGEHNQAFIEAGARKKLTKAEELVSAGEYDEAWKIYWGVWTDLDLATVRKDMMLPILVSSDPEGADVYVDGVLVGTATNDRPLFFKPTESARTILVRLERRGYETVTKEPLPLQLFQRIVNVPMKRKVRSTVSVDGAVHGVPLDFEGQLVICARGGSIPGDSAAMIYRLAEGMQVELPANLAEAGGKITTPLIHQGALFAGTSEGKLYRITPYAPLRLLAVVQSDETDVGIPITAGPAALAEGKWIYFATYDGRVFRFDPTIQNAKPQVIFRAEGQITSLQCLPAPDGDSDNPWVIIGSLDEKVRVLLGRTGEVVWQFLAHGDVFAPPVVTRSHVYVGTSQGAFFILDRMTGKQLKAVHGYGPVLSLAGTDEIAYIGGIKGGSGVTALSVPSCDKLWAWATAGPVDSGIRLHEGKILFGDHSGRLSVLDARTGEFRWDYVAGAPITAKPLCARGRVYVGDDTGQIAIINLSIDDDEQEESPR